MLVVDPISALSYTGDSAEATAAALQLINAAKSAGVTAVNTTLVESPVGEATYSGISTVADTWIQLSYQPQGGERNRALSVVKSRGTGHSKQVRELLLSDDGVTLEDVYTAGGQVLMGTLRYEREAEEAALRQKEADERESRIIEARERVAEAHHELVTLQEELRERQASLERLERSAALAERDEHALHAALHAKRGGDPKEKNKAQKRKGTHPSSNGSKSRRRR